MNIFRAKHVNSSESPVRTLYGRKGNFLLLPLDVCILQVLNGRDEFRPSPEATHLIVAPIQQERLDTYYAEQRPDTGDATKALPQPDRSAVRSNR